MIDDFVNRPHGGGDDDPKREDFMPDLSEPKRSPGDEIGPPVQPAVDPFEGLENDPKLPEVPTQPEEVIQFDNDPNSEPPKLLEPPKRRWWQKLTAWFQGLGKKQKALVILGAALFVIGGSIGVYALFYEPPQPPPGVNQEPEPEPQPTTVPNTLTGRQVAPEINGRQVTAVMIENSMEARPQAGLQQAGVVFEAIAEGGITRFIALYQDTNPKSIGPVRSVRPYYISWAQGFDAAIAHVGGSPEALQQIRSRKLKDLDQFAHASYYQRVTDRYAPHNVFTSISQLRKLQNSLGYKSSDFTGFDRIAETDDEDKTEPETNTTGTTGNQPTATPKAGKIQVNISSTNYNSAYTYNKKSNTYKRTMGGVAHKDHVSGKQITPDVVVVMTVSYGIHSDGQHSVYGTVGKGQVHIFQNGEVLKGTWRKKSHDSQIIFTDANGDRMKLNPGQTWITAVSSSDKIKFQP